MAGEVIGDNSLSLAPNVLTRQRDRWNAVLLRGLEEVIQPGEKAHIE